MDVAIIGGGVAGCYCAYRLAQAHPDWDIQLFEASDRIGGRLWSVPIEDVEGSPLDMGGMFFSDRQLNVYGLSTHLALNPLKVGWSRKHHFLRGEYLNDITYEDDPSAVPFKLDDPERGKGPIALLAYALARIVPGMEDLWPLNVTPPRSARATYDRLRLLRHNGRKLYESGFWNILSDVLSNEAYNLLYSTIGSGSLFRNGNAFDVVWTLLREFADQSYYKIPDGYQRLPLKMLEEARRTVRVHYRHRLFKIKRKGPSFALRLDTVEGKTKVEADRVILALPRRAIQLINVDSRIFDDADAFERDLDAVSSERACKLFLNFEGPWWDRSKAGPSLLEAAQISAAYTDLPMRQCYYYGKQAGSGPALLMAAYADDAAVSFWSGLAKAGGGTFSNAAKNAVEQETLSVSNAMVTSALRQLTAMHRDMPAPLPTAAYFVDWGRDPYGAGWHAWAPNLKSWQVGPRIRQPNARLGLFVCGEAYSQWQGWVEGAINSAEMVMRRLGLGPPSWVTDADYVFEMEGESPMTNNLTELLVALSGSLELQKAYARNREAIMSAFGLSEVEKAALRSGDEAAIVRLSSDGAQIFNFIIKYATKLDK